MFLLNCDYSKKLFLLDCSQFKRNRRNISHFAEKKRSWNQAFRQYKYKGKHTASDLSTIRTASDSSTIQFRLIFKGHKSLEYTGCFMIHLASAITISYAESNGGIFVLIAPFGNTNTNTRTNVLRVICQQYVLRAISCQYNFA
jgi:hypothetical protein